MNEKNTACNLSFEQIKELALIAADKRLAKIQIKNGDCEILIEAEKPCQTAVQPMPSVTAVQTSIAAPVAQSVTEVTAAESKAEVSGNVVKSPIVGTFYASASPDKPAFVSIGKQVKKGDVLMIIESMKLMNEIQSEFAGTVKEILVKNGEAVEFDQPLMIIE